MTEESEKLALFLLAIIIVGIIGNTLNLFVFSHKKMALKNSIFKYLLYLSVIDMLVLIVCTSDTFLTYGYYIMIRSYSIYICRFHTFLTYYLTQMSSLILMVVSIDRALIICNKKFSSLLSFRRKIRLLNNQRSSKIYHSIMNKINNGRGETLRSLISKINLNKIEKSILTIAISLALINSHFLVFMNINVFVNQDDKHLARLNTSSTNHHENKSINYKEFITNQVKEMYRNHSLNATPARTVSICSPIPGSFYMGFIDKIWVWIDMCLYSLIPFIVMAVCSVIIIREIRQKTTSLTFASNKILMKKRSKRNKQLLLVLLVTNSYFIVTSLPLGVMMIYYKMYDQPESEQHFSQTLLHVMAYSNNAVSFIFCSLFSKEYRLLMANLFRKVINTSKASSSQLKYLGFN